MTVPSGMGWAGISAVPIPPDQPEGYILTKESDRDYDMEWLAASAALGLFVIDGIKGEFIFDPNCELVQIGENP